MEKIFFAVFILSCLVPCAYSVNDEDRAASASSDSRFPARTHHYSRSFYVSPDLISGSRYAAEPYRRTYHTEPAGRIVRRPYSDRLNRNEYYPTASQRRQYSSGADDRYYDRGRYYQSPSERASRYGAGERPAPIRSYNAGRFNKMREEIERRMVEEATQRKMYEMKRQIKNCEDDLSNCAYNAEELVDKIYQYEKIRGRLPSRLLPEDDETATVVMNGFDAGVSNIGTTSTRALCISFCSRNRLTDKYSISCRSYIYNLNFKLISQRKRMMALCYDCRGQCPEDY